MNTVPNGATVYFVDNDGVNHTATVINGQATFADLSYPNYGTTYTYDVKYDGSIYYKPSSTIIVLNSEQYKTTVTDFSISGYQNEQNREITITVSSGGSQLFGNLTVTDIFGNNYKQYHYSL